jgi:hypothetical protein
VPCCFTSFFPAKKRNCFQACPLHAMVPCIRTDNQRNLFCHNPRQSALVCHHCVASHKFPGALFDLLAEKDCDAVSV